MTRLPDFLIIGAQKAGTTTLYQDLSTHPQIAFSYEKEPHSLCYDKVLTPKGRRQYGQYFSHVKPGQICGEASTGYTRFPQFSGAARRAREVLGPEIGLIYILRNPVDRAVSQHHHSFTDGDMPASIDEAVISDERPIAFSRYAFQLEPWLEHFNGDRLMLLVFEEYMRQRRQSAAAIEEFLRVEPRPELINPEAMHNTAENRRKTPKLMRQITRSDVYSRIGRRWIPAEFRQLLVRRLLPPAPPRPAPPSAETVDRILDATREDCQRIVELLGRTSTPWDEAETRARWQQRRESFRQAQVGDTARPPDPSAGPAAPQSPSSSA